MAPRPFHIHVADSVLDDLRRRLEHTRWPQPIPGTGWDYGANLDAVRDLCDHWQTRYDWRAQEVRLNRHPGFVANVDGLDLHFWHVRSPRKNRFPLLLIHGWPGSIVEFQHLIEPLTEPPSGQPAFDVVVASLPGFGFSGRPTERGWGVTRIAAAFDTLMTRELGYERYGCQGGDWGGIISSKMASAHSDHVAAIHLNFAIGWPPAEMTDDDRAFAAAQDVWRREETGYSEIQRSRPDSLTVAQSDSPAGLAAWILEKFRAWADCNGDPLNAFDRDTLITNIMFYWAPNSIASAARIYYEALRDPSSFAYPRVEVPTAIARFPKEPWAAPRHWLEPRYNIQQWTDMPRGGHFAALEAPELLLDDIRKFFAAAT